MKTEIKPIIFVLLITFSLLTGLAAYSNCFSPTTSDLLINLAAGGISSLFTIFVIDWLIQENENRKWKDAKTTARSEMITLTNMLTSYISTPLGYKPTDYQINPKDVEASSRKVIKQIVEQLQSQNWKTLLDGLTIKKWEHLQINLLFIHPTINQSVQLYSQVLPPEVLGKLLIVRKDFHNLYNSFSLVPELFTKSQANWPENKGGLENNKSIRQSLLESFSKELKDYFTHLSDLIKIIDDWKK